MHKATLSLLPFLFATLLVVGLACADEPDPAPSPTPAVTPKPARTPRPAGSYGGEKEGPGWAYVVIDGQKMTVRWSDGDSFKFKDGPYEGSGVRMMGFNTLESYGPVHRWGKWTPQELYAIAHTSKDLASSQDWTCTTDGERDGYHRLLVSCPDAALYMVQQGHAHVFAVGGEPDPALVQAQKIAQRKKVGMWKKGIPKEIITSLHSADETWKGRDSPYDRVADARTGVSHKVEHHDTYAECQEVCLGAKKEQSCMTYVPFKHRYHSQPACLKAR